MVSWVLVRAPNDAKPWQNTDERYAHTFWASQVLLLGLIWVLAYEGTTSADMRWEP